MGKITENRFTDKEYAEYMMANYYLGYTDIALFLGAVLFENIIMKKVSKYKNEYIKKRKMVTKNEEKNSSYVFNLHDAINIYTDIGDWQSDVLCKNVNMDKKNINKELHKYRNIRNDIAHTNIQKRSKITNDECKVEQDDFLQYVYTSITHISKSKNFFKKQTPNETLLQDYKRKEIDERMLSNLDGEYLKPEHNKYKDFKYISVMDFENLFELREKMVVIKEAITNYSKEYELGLTETILSPIDTTSAYIWMPFINNDFTNFANKFETKRNNLISGSVSILATPMDFRIYIDFGGGDYKYRLLYQDFLQSKKFNTYIQRYRGLSQPLEIFDIRWYSFIIKRNDLFDIIDKNMLEEFSMSAKNKINTEEKQNNIMTAGYNKIGFILPPRDIKLGEIVKLFECITHLYYEFLQYKCNDKSSIDTLKEKQQILRNRCKYARG